MAPTPHPVAPPTGRLEAYARTLRKTLASRDLARLAAPPEGELVLLIADGGGAATRLVIRMENGLVSVLDEASSRYIPQAILKTELDTWTELLRTGRIDPDRVDLYGDTAVLQAFLDLHQLSQRPLDLRCAMMSAAKKTTRSLRARNLERNVS